MKLNITSIFLSILFSIANSDYMLDMAAEQNIRIERHEITTMDGYILGLYRLPAENNETDENRSNKTETKTLLLMHGLESSSPMYILYPGRSAGQFFQNLGYDVWIGNARGNTFSRKHIKLEPDDPKFWSFSWHEIGYYDVPAIIDYALSYTKQDQLVYIGHSQGVTSAFVMLSERPEYNRKISILHAMTPPIIMKYHHPVTPDNENNKKLEEWVENTNNHEFFRYEEYSSLFITLGDLCPNVLLLSPICKNILDFLPGPASPNCYTDSIAADYATHMPAGSGYRQFLHYIQISNSGRFQKYDFGTDENVRIYGSSRPPEYNFSNIQTKIHILYGTHDYLVMRQNIPALVKKIKHAVVAVHRFNYFNHMDFAYGRLVESVQQFILKITKRFDGSSGVIEESETNDKSN